MVRPLFGGVDLQCRGLGEVLCMRIKGGWSAYVKSVGRLGDG